MERVYVRFPQLSGVARLEPGEVISRVGDEVRVKLMNEGSIRTVTASDVQAIPNHERVRGFDNRTPMVKQAFPTASHALGRV